MQESNQTSPDAACDGRCEVCSGSAGKPESDPEAGGLAGFRLMGWSALVFLLPLVTSIAASVLAGGQGARALGAALAGFAAGAAVAALVVQRLLRHRKGHAPHSQTVDGGAS